MTPDALDCVDCTMVLPNTFVSAELADDVWDASIGRWCRLHLSFVQGSTDTIVELIRMRRSVVIHALQAVVNLNAAKPGRQS